MIEIVAGLGCGFLLGFIASECMRVGNGNPVKGLKEVVDQYRNESKRKKDIASERVDIIIPCAECGTATIKTRSDEYGFPQFRINCTCSHKTVVSKTRGECIKTWNYERKCEAGMVWKEIE